ncbi:MAG: CCA tRNA nucleotidyltransferase [Arcobacteraceae bacterium]|nr:CCA tRNA nucleotidyltransferase [Arcobacteraceae bacterium]MDY0327255.1 CCA tRNA nucleotidyltransferase [Arcobacteraceae bacterium]
MKNNRLEILEFLKTTFLPFTNRVYFVGGYVRDSLLGIECDDIDIEVYDIDLERFSALMDSIGAIGVGKSFFVYKYKDIDISLPRTEVKTSIGHTGFEVSYCNCEKTASKRRDFTINALMKNIYTEEILDFYGGIEDLHLKKIKIVDKNSFVEDSLRVLRGIRFASRFGFEIDSESLEIMKDINLDDLSDERVSKEFELIFATKYLEVGFYYLCKLHLIEKYFKITLTYQEFINITKLLVQTKPYFNPDFYEYYLLYILNSIKPLCFDVLKSKKYIQHIKKQPSLNFAITKKELLIISLEIPICNWLGALNNDIINKAKELNIYEHTLDTGVCSQSVIQDGFSGKSIGEEITKRKLKFIDDKILS